MQTKKRKKKTKKQKTKRLYNNLIKSLQQWE